MSYALAAAAATAVDVDVRLQQNETHLATLSETVTDSNIQLHGALQDVFDQLMERLEAMEANKI